MLFVVKLKNPESISGYLDHLTNYGLTPAAVDQTLGKVWVEFIPPSIELDAFNSPLIDFTDVVKRDDCCD